jgi:hypothetical protein
MITIYCALYREAQELIRAFGLKKETEQNHFQVFSDVEQNVRIVITGVGGVAAATAVAEVSTCYPPGKGDFLLNFGSCAAGEKRETGQVFLCHKITEEGSGRTFYPDVLYRHPFAEAALVSAARVKKPEELSGADGLFDMEAAAIYQAGNYYYSPHQMIFVKVVTDHGVSDTLQDFTEQMREASRQVISFVEQLKKLCDSEQESADRLCVARQEAAEESKRLAEELHCSATMSAELSQLLYYCRLMGKEEEKLIADYRERGCIPAKDKREGKRLLEELRANLL